MTEAENKVIIVTGGTGLVGQAIKTIVDKEEKQPNEKWIFLSSKDANLLYVFLSYFIINFSS